MFSRFSVVCLILATARSRIFGTTCECVGRHGMYSWHKHSNAQGVAISSLVGHVANHITSKAITHLLTHAQGHSPISSCDQEKLDSMETEYKSCVRKVQYQIKCLNLTNVQQCALINAFLDHCTTDLLGACFQPPFLTYLLEIQKWKISQNGHFHLKQGCVSSVPNKRPRLPKLLKKYKERKDKAWDRAKLLRKYLRHPSLKFL